MTRRTPSVPRPAVLPSVNNANSDNERMLLTHLQDLSLLPVDLVRCQTIFYISRSLGYRGNRTQDLEGGIDEGGCHPRYERGCSTRRVEKGSRIAAAYTGAEILG